MHLDQVSKTSLERKELSCIALSVLKRVSLHVEAAMASVNEVKSYFDSH